MIETSILNNKFVNLCILGFSRIPRYFTTLFKLLFYPRSTLNRLLIRNNKAFIDPYLFFVVNISIVVTVDKILAHALSDKTIRNYIHFPSAIFNAIVPYILGMLIFIFILGFILDPNNILQITFKIIPLYCLGSAIFIPLYFIRLLAYSFIGKEFLSAYMNMLYNALAGGSIHIKLGYVDLLKSIFYLSFYLVIIAFWIALISIGLKMLGFTTRIKMKVILSLFCYSIVKFVIVVIVSISMYFQVYKTFKIIDNKEIAKALNSNPPSYGTAEDLALQVAETKNIPLYAKYHYHIIAFGVKSFTFYASINKPIIEELKKRDYYKWDDIIKNNVGYVQKMRRTSQDNKIKALCSCWLKEYNEIKVIQNDPKYIEYPEGESVTMFFEAPRMPFYMFP